MPRVVSLYCERCRLNDHTDAVCNRRNAPYLLAPLTTMLPPLQTTTGTNTPPTLPPVQTVLDSLSLPPISSLFSTPPLRRIHPIHATTTAVPYIVDSGAKSIAPSKPQALDDRRASNKLSHQRRRAVQSEAQRNATLVINRIAHIEARERETHEERNDRLAKARERYRVSKALKLADFEAQFLAPDIVSVLHRDGLLTPITLERKEAIIAKFKESLTHANLAYQTCLISGSLCRFSDLVLVPVMELPIRIMNAMYKHPAGMDQKLVKFYDLGDLDIRLKGMALDRTAFHLVDGNIPYVWIHSGTWKTICRLNRGFDPSKSYYPTRFAIADYFILGRSDILDALNSSELQTVTLCQTRAKLSFLKGGKNKVVTSHFMSWDCSQRTAAQCLPTYVSGNYRAILAGPFDSAQELASKTPFLQNVDKIRAASEFLLANNQFARGLPLNSHILSSITPEGVIERLDASTLGETEYRHLSGILHSLERNVESVRQPEFESTAPNGITVLQYASGLVNLESASSMSRLEATIESAIADSSVTDTTAKNATCESPTTPQASIDSTVRPGTLVIKHSGQLIKSQHEMTMSYVRHFPYGQGGPRDSRRKHKYSLKAIVSYYLRLGALGFRNDPDFVLYAHDKLSMSGALTSMHLKCKGNPSIAHDAANLDPSDVKAFYDWEMECARARDLFQATPPQTEQVKRVSRLISTVRSSGVAKFPGSSAERAKNRVKLESLQFDRGVPNIFWTLTPSDTGSALLAFYAHELMPKDIRYEDITPAHMPDGKAMLKVVLDNPVVAADTFLVVLDLFIKHVLGFDMQAGRSYSQGGAYGFLEAIAHFIECQEGGTLHTHGVAWIHGAPRSEKEWATRIQESGWKDGYDTFLQSVVSSNYPIYEFDKYKPQCCNSCPLGSLIPIHLSPKLRGRRSKKSPLPKLAMCTSCSQRFSSPELLKTSITSAIEDLRLQDPDSLPIVQESHVLNLGTLLAPFSEKPLVAAIQKSIFLHHVQEHYHYHCAGCFKKGEKCRYRMPHQNLEQTGFNKDNKYRFHTELGCNYLNNICDVWFSCIPGNHDSRFLQLGDGADVVLYATKYATKASLSVQVAALAAIATRYQKRIANEDPDLEPYRRGLRRLMSLMSMESNMMEVSSSLAALFLTTHTSGHFSCDFKPLLLCQGLDMFQSAQTEINMSLSYDANSRKFTVGHLFLDYMHRPPVLEQCCLRLFDQHYEKVLISKTGAHKRSHEEMEEVIPEVDGDDAENGWMADVSEDEGEQLYCPQSMDSSVQVDAPTHPQFLTHQLRYLPKPRVPNLIGPRIPSSADTEPNLIERRARSILLLQYPWRSLDMFFTTNSSNSVIPFYTSWVPHQNAATIRFIDNLDNWHLSKVIAKQQVTKKRVDGYIDPDDLYGDDEPDEERLQDPLFSSGAQDASDAYIDADNDDFEPVEYDSEMFSSIYCNLDCESANNTFSEVSRFTNFTRSPNHIHLDKASSHAPAIHSLKAMKQVLKKYKGHPLAQIPETPGPSMHVPTNRFPIASVSLLPKLSDVIVNLHYSKPTVDDMAKTLGMYPTVAEVSKKFNLNLKQHAVFATYGSYLVSRFIEPTSSETPPRSIVAGGGGVGKTRIVNALMELARLYNRPTAIKKMAPSGIAASGIGGETMHRVGRFSQGMQFLPEHHKQWEAVELLVMDEAFMIGQDSFFKLNKAFNTVKQVSDEDNVYFGGLAVMLLGDVFQKRPVKDEYLFVPPTNVSQNASDSQKEAYYRKKKAYDVYMSFTSCYYLTESMRFVTDPLFGYHLSNARVGLYSTAFRAALNSQVQSTEKWAEFNTDSHPALVCTGSNIIRRSYNDSFIKARSHHQSSLTHPTFRLVAKLASVKPRNKMKPPLPLTPDMVRYIYTLGDEKGKRLSPILDIYVGMDVCLSSNSCVPAGLANGTLGKIVSIHWASTTTFAEFVRVDGSVFQRSSEMPEYVLVRIPDNDHDVGFGPGIFPVMAESQTSDAIKMCGKTANFRITQLGFTPAFCLTDYRVQGLTLPRLLLAPFSVSKREFPKLHQDFSLDAGGFYVLISRVRELRSLMLLRAISDQEFDSCQPKDYVIDEDDRLIQLSTVTNPTFPPEESPMKFKRRQRTYQGPVPAHLAQQRFSPFLPEDGHTCTPHPDPSTISQLSHAWINVFDDTDTEFNNVEDLDDYTNQLYNEAEDNLDADFD
ncbi:hypothetical protein BCR33DRAFT_766220 [Rhizoclosmatium globosum]|uniref:ATP-dependent DNA helicase n=1 Tax=Rhizoclosmatium globosum TaxID=329046 RepID=A0A1Y2CCK9_9FUNG|nr:hypothetical protein BCR33DRAFT_766220 [Rhizoclosmatium globosum]|eukprot:ORY44055.1 hypothetical protein BCR33DRAFT_766220 [Rhizoclosmatium globosum]